METVVSNLSLRFCDFTMTACHLRDKASLHVGLSQYLCPSLSFSLSDSGYVSISHSEIVLPQTLSAIKVLSQSANYPPGSFARRISATDQARSSDQRQLEITTFSESAVPGIMLHFPQLPKDVGELDAGEQQIARSKMLDTTQLPHRRHIGRIGKTHRAKLLRWMFLRMLQHSALSSSKCIICALTAPLTPVTTMTLRRAPPVTAFPESVFISQKRERKPLPIVASLHFLHRRFR